MARTPPLYDAHAAAEARFTDFGGWEMPVQFDSIRTEHASVREDVGRFDVSHMGQIEVTGPDAAALLQRLTTNDVTVLDPGEGQYAAITDEDGVMLDDTVVYRLPASDRFLFIPNAGHDEEMADRCDWLADDRGLDVSVENATTDWAMFAVQGPEALDRYGEVTDKRFDLDRFEIGERSIAGVDCLIAATGYTGERGFEALVPWEEAETVWEAFDCQRCGLGARDTLRLEMGFLLSGQDFHPEDDPRNPYEAGIGFVVKLDTDFVGRDALEAVASEGPRAKLTGLRLIDRGVPRDGHAVTTPSGTEVGEVTSGTMSPTLGRPIAMAYLPTTYTEPGTNLRVVIRDEPKKAQTTTTPFLDR
jgi:aminomethyltransferase